MSEIRNEVWYVVQIGVYNAISDTVADTVQNAVWRAVWNAVYNTAGKITTNKDNWK